MSVEADNQRGPIAWMARNSIAANLIMVLLLAGGIWTAVTMQKEVFPQFELDIVTVSVSYPGAAPEEVEQGILLPIEEAVRAVQGVREMRSVAREGSGSVTLELLAGVDRMKVYQDVDQAVSQIRTFPEDTEEPDVRLQTRVRDVMEIGLFGDVSIPTLRTLGERVRDQLLSQPEIAQVELGNVPAYMTHVEISGERLREFDLTLGQVAEIIARSSRDIPAGAIDTRGGELLLRLNERKQWADEFANIAILSADDGSQVLLGDIATVTDGFEEAGFHSQFNRQPSIELEIFRLGKQSPLDVAAAVERVIDDLQYSLPEGVQVRIDSNRAKDFSDRLFLLLENGGMAIIIILVILALFLEFRLAFWVMMGMAISFIGAINLLPPLGISINMISMFGFLVALGIVVDDAIVVGENVYQRHEQGMGMMASAIDGAREMAWPVTFSILTNIVAFIPVMLLPGVTGNYWFPMPVVVVCVLALSLFEALFILPAHLAHIKERRHNKVGDQVHGWQTAFSRGFNRWVDRRYRPFLAGCLVHRYLSLLVASALLAITLTFAYSDHMGIVMMPEEAADEIEAGVRLPVGTTRDQSARVANQLTNATHRMFEEHDLYQDAEGIKTNVRGQSFIDVEIVLRPRAERERSARDVIQLWRDQLEDIEGVDQITFEAERGPGSWRDDISIALSHNDIDVLVQASQTLQSRMRELEALQDVSDNFRLGKSQLDITLRPEGRALGLTSSEIGRQIRDGFFGALALRYLRGTNEVEVRVKLPEAERKDLRYLEGFTVRAPDGTEVPLTDVADVTESEAFASIDRRDGLRAISIGTDVEPASATNQVLEVIQGEILPDLRADYPGLTWQFAGTQADMRESTAALYGGFALALFVIYALLAIAFGSYVQPLIVMMAIPFGVVGAVIGHLLLDEDLSLVSLMGMVAVSGVVVNGALIMVHFANTRYQELGAFKAIHQAGVRRFRPIVLTTVTTFGGLTPIIFETSPQAVHLIPMAISLGFGIVFATGIMLVVVPCLYLVFEDAREACKRLYVEG
jgi:multidrug efflux pump subunit AcrB